MWLAITMITKTKFMIFLNILKKKIGFSDFTYESKGEEYLKTRVSNETCFRKDKEKETNKIPNEKTKYNCRVLLQIQSVYYSMNDKDIRYYPQVLMEQCSYKPFFNNTIIHPDLEFTNSEPDSESEDKEFNEDTV